MQQFTKRPVITGLSLIGLAAGFMPAAGCQTTFTEAGIGRGAIHMGTSSSLPASQQLMIKLKDAIRSCNEADIAGLATATGEALTFLRPMSGNACVVSHAAKDGAALRSGLQRLNSHQAVEWAELDAIFKPA